jgi:hypothetical protein
MVTTRLGGAGIVVLPNLWEMVTGKAASPLGVLDGVGVVVGDELQAARTAFTSPMSVYFWLA